MTARESTGNGRRGEMGRPRSFTDEEAFLATKRVLLHKGASELTLADVARELTCTGQALNARFGTRKRLLVAYSEWVLNRDLDRFRQARFDSHSPLAALRARFATPVAGREEELADGGAQLHLLSLLAETRLDPDLMERHNERIVSFKSEVARLITEAVEAGELSRSIDAWETADLILVAMTGASILWSVNERGSIVDEILYTLDRILNPYLTTGEGDPDARNAGHCPR